MAAASPDPATECPLSPEAEAAWGARGRRKSRSMLENAHVPKFLPFGPSKARGRPAQPARAIKRPAAALKRLAKRRQASPDWSPSESEEPAEAAAAPSRRQLKLLEPAGLSLPQIQDQERDILTAINAANLGGRLTPAVAETFLGQLDKLAVKKRPLQPQTAAAADRCVLAWADLQHCCLLMNRGFNTAARQDTREGQLVIHLQTSFHVHASKPCVGCNLRSSYAYLGTRHAGP